MNKNSKDISASDTAASDTFDWIGQIRKQIYKVRWALFASFITMLFFVLIGAISLAVALLAFSFLTGAIFISLRPSNKTISVKENIIDIEALRENNLFEFINILSEPCFIIDEKSIILHMNNNASSQFEGAMTGNPIAFSLRNPDFLLAIETALTTKLPQKVIIQQTLPSKTWFDISIVFFGSNEDKKSPIKLVIIMHDISKQKNIEAMRVDFIANVSHELRTPLTSLIGFIETLQGPAAKDIKSRKKFLEIMNKQAQRMSKLIDDLLSLSHIELSEHDKPVGKVDLTQTINNVIEGLQNQLKEADLKVKLAIPSEPIIITGDKDELFETFENLIDNAIKYGEGSDFIEIKLAPVNDRDGFDYLLNIIDHGVGISSKHLPRLTERFYRVDVQKSRKKKGTGLGLAIVKHILNRHSAKMNISSKRGKGTNVEVLFKK